MLFRKLKWNWRHTAGELAIVAAGVVLGLAANGWISDVGQRRAESASLMRLADDMSVDIADISGDRARTQRSYAAALWLMRHREGPMPPADSLSVGLTDLTACSILGVNTSEYTALKSSGQLSILRDADFRQRLVNLYEGYPYLSSLYDLACRGMEEAISSIQSEVEFGIDSTLDTWPITLTGDPEKVLHNPAFQRSVGYAAKTMNVLTPLEQRVIAELEVLRERATDLAGH